MSNCQPLKVVDRGSEKQAQVVKIYNILLSRIGVKFNLLKIELYMTNMLLCKQYHVFMGV